MKSATEILRREHEAILKMLDVIEEVARRMEAGEMVAAETLADLLQFFRQFADQCHHGKEEELLFPRLQEKGMPRAGGPIAVMLADHEQGRALVQQMAEAAQAYQAGQRESAPRWVRAARGYSALLRGHIDKENKHLFPMAERMLRPEDLAELAQAFEKIEVDKMGAGAHERLHAMMDKMATEFLPKQK